MKLHFGVDEMPYAWVYSPTPKKGARKAKRASRSGLQTTVDVARILEAKYGVMGHFYERHGQDIADALADGMHKVLRDVMAGLPPPPDPFAGSCAKIVTMFHRFIDLKEMDGMVEGVPTQASLKGIRRRFKARRDPGRPSFQDTALYEDTMRAWMET